MFIMMVISLFTSRIVLNTLGVADYGTYNVVGGVVSMFTIVTTSISSSVVRFITFELGRGNLERQKQLFTTMILVMLVISLVMFIIIELVGVWFLNAHMNIPAERMSAANFVLQCSILSFIISLNYAPYNATIIAHERFGIYAYTTIIEAVLKLGVVFLLYVSTFDKLKTYALLLLIVGMFLPTFFFVYCRRNFKECRFKFVYDKNDIKQFASFSGWSFFTNASWVLNTQGINLLINIFFGVTINAARGIASQVDSAVTNFVYNFTNALNPQITKSYASGDFDYLHKLIYASARYSSYLMLFCLIPIGIETHKILLLWLNQVPDYSVPFVRFTLLSSLMVALSNSLSVAQNSTGKIRKYSIVTSIFTFSIFPLTFIAFKLGYSPTSTFIINFAIYFILAFVKVFLVSKYIDLSVSKYIREVICPVAIVTFFSSLIPLFFFMTQPESVLRLLEVLFFSILSIIVCVYVLGMEKGEKEILVQFVCRKLNISQKRKR